MEPRAPSQVQPYIDKHLLLDLHDEERGSGKLHIDTILSERAQEHAEWMADKERLQHSRLKLDNWRIMGENIAWGQRSEEEVMNSWMRSRGHRANIMNKRFSHLGIGYAISEDGSPYWCVIFAG